ncbi:alpha/beta hydrolase [Streptomyces sp. SID13031]|uniref:alpha/beta hydrolase n=1 Tax=Streptomyces sp. SID13031 TaxID=2706046 RepID=UPI0013C9A009|nr:alpha/beta hydrolase [Streptomyces sp. SID13031]NEA31324.1 alpha/beta hydrolase [Streptomyces sp. SID13031]
MTSDQKERLGAGRYIASARMPTSTVTSAHELTTHDGAGVNGLLRVVPGATTVAFLMHPRQDFSHHILVPELLNAGYAVWTQGSRSMGNDLTLLHEQAVLDMAAGHAFLRRRDFESVVSVGHSGGASLAAFYIEQAALTSSARLTATPGGKPVPLAEATMPVPDGLMLMAPHPGQGELLLRVIDPSVVDESDPLSIDPRLDPYAEGNGFVVPPASSSYSGDFIAEYRAAQQRRVDRIDALAYERAAAADAARRRYSSSNDPGDRREALASGVIVVHRTDADLRGVDLSLDANDRPYGSLFGGRPDLTNYGVIGFGRLTTPEAWLSTWSGRSSRAALLRCAPSVRVPVLLVELTGDQACFPADAQAMVAAFAAADVTHVRVEGKHFGAPLTEGATSGATLAGQAMAHWLGTRFPASAGGGHR